MCIFDKQNWRGCKLSLASFLWSCGSCVRRFHRRRSGSSSRMLAATHFSSARGGPRPLDGLSILVVGEDLEEVFQCVLRLWVHLNSLGERQDKDDQISLEESVLVQEET